MGENPEMYRRESAPSDTSTRARVRGVKAGMEENPPECPEIRANTLWRNRWYDGRMKRQGKQYACYRRLASALFRGERVVCPVVDPDHARKSCEGFAQYLGSTLAAIGDETITYGRGVIAYVTPSSGIDGQNAMRSPIRTQQAGWSEQIEVTDELIKAVQRYAKFGAFE